MADLQKVIKGMECCIISDEESECPDACPYYDECWKDECWKDESWKDEFVIGLALRKDALELLKQYAKVMEKGRVLQFDEIEYYTVVWLEDRDKSDLLMAVCQKDAPSEKRFTRMNRNEDSIVGKKYDYMKRWRAWDEMPNRMQREAAKWDD